MKANIEKRLGRLTQELQQCDRQIKVYQAQIKNINNLAAEQVTKSVGISGAIVELENMLAEEAKPSGKLTPAPSQTQAAKKIKKKK